MKRPLELRGCLLLMLMFSMLLGSTGVAHASPSVHCVMWVFDLSGSMGGFLPTAKSIATTLTPILNSMGICTGVASHIDYPHHYDCPCEWPQCRCPGDPYSGTYGSGTDYPWKLHHQCGEGAAHVAMEIATINAMTASGGADLPECYARVLYELHTSVNWCPGIKIAVHFGDSEPHFCPIGTGGDPGPNEICENCAVGTDDLCWNEELVAFLADPGFYIFIGPSESPGYEYAWDVAPDYPEMFAYSLEDMTACGLEHIIRELITPPVGGIWVPVDKLGLLAPYIALAVAVVAVTIGAASARKHWSGKAAVSKP